MEIAIVLTVATILMALEFFLPSLGLLSVMSLICYAYGIYVSYLEYGVVGGLAVTSICIFLVVLVLMMWLKLFPKTKFTKKLSLQSVATPVENQNASLVGEEGIALTDMAPTGKVSINNAEYEAQSDIGFIEKTSKVSVVAADNFKLKVKKI